MTGSILGKSGFRKARNGWCWPYHQRNGPPLKSWPIRRTSKQPSSANLLRTKNSRFDMEFLHDGMPRVHRQAMWSGASDVKRSGSNIKLQDLGLRASDLGRVVLGLLAHPNIASKKWIVRQYDHEVQGGSVIKPFVGLDQRGPSDACVFRPRLDAPQGVVVSNGFNPSYSALDPYWMAACAIDEALRNLVAVGGDIRQTALL